MSDAILRPRASGRWMTLLRCGTGTVLFFTFAAYWQDFQLLHHPRRGLVDPDLLLLLAEGPMPTVGEMAAAVHRWTGLGIASILTGVGVLYLGCCLLLALHLYPRLAAIGLLFLHHAIYIAMPAFSYGADYLGMSALFCCCLAPAPTAHRGNVAVLRALQALLCFVYFMGGYDKLGRSWLSGEALWKALHLPGYIGWAHPLIGHIPYSPALWAASGTAVVLLELSYPILIWFRRTRAVVLAAIIGMHVAIAALMGLYYFSAMMIVLNAAAFIAPYTHVFRPTAHPVRLSPGGPHPILAPDGVSDPPTQPLSP